MRFWIAEDDRTVGYRWQAVVREYRRARHPLRSRLALWLRWLAVRIDP